MLCCGFAVTAATREENVEVMVVCQILGVFKNPGIKTEFLA